MFAARVDPTVSQQPAAGVRAARANASTTGTAPLGVHRVVARPGQPLPEPVRRLAGAGNDFASVRVHSDASARDFGADAYTVGSDIVFAPGRYAPETASGMRLVAHELAHVAQQRGAGPLRQRALTVGPRDDPAEREADAVADAALSARPGSGRMLEGIGQPRCPEPIVRRQGGGGHIEPHYPTEDEQREIQKLMNRKFEAPAPPAPAASPARPPPAADRGRVLTAPERRAMVARLRSPVLAANAALGPSPSTANAADAATALAAAQRARQDIVTHFGRYVGRVVTLTQEAGGTPEGRRRAGQVLFAYRDTNTARDLMRTLATTNCQTCKSAFAGLEVNSRNAVINELTDSLVQTSGPELLRSAIAHVPGGYAQELERLRLAPRSEDEIYGTSLHELMHTMAHPVFRAAFGDEDNVNEGFNEYFTLQILATHPSKYGEVADMVTQIKSAMSGPFVLPSIGGTASEESLRLAYFGGRLDLIGWRPSTDDEAAAVAAAMREHPVATLKPGASVEWSADTAREHAKAYRDQALAAQDTHKSVIGTGLFFQPKSGGNVAVSYARVLAQTEYARGRALVEGQIFGAPISDPKAIGGSVGLAGEYQEPYFYAAVGARFFGTALQGEPGLRIDLSPFVGGGIRAWQRIRVGGEGFVVLPLTGEDKTRGYGGAVRVGVEF